MRIFSAVRHSSDPAFFYGGLWSGNFYPAIRRLGHEVAESKVDLLPASRFMHVPGNFTPEEFQVRADLTQQIIDEVRQAHRERPIDLFLSYFYNSHFDAAGFSEIHRMGIPTVNFYCNSIYQFDLVAEVAAAAQWAWHAEKHARKLYLQVGARPVWVQMGADPVVYRPIDGEPRQANACFVGQRYADRDRLMFHLATAGVPLAIYGPGWAGTDGAATAGNTGAVVAERGSYLGRSNHSPGSLPAYLNVIARNIERAGLCGGLVRSWRQACYRRESRRLLPALSRWAQGPIPFTQICQVFSRHEVVLNFAAVWADGAPGSSLINHVRLRDFEAPMCRTCYLTGHTDEIEEFYDVGREIDAYRSPEELVEKVRYYLRHPQEAERLREAGFRRAVGQHTWTHRFAQLFSEIGLQA